MIERLHTAVATRLAGLDLEPHELLERDAPSGLDVPGVMSANRHCRLLRARDGWAALNLARPEDVELVPVLTGIESDRWDALAVFAAGLPASELCQRAAELHMPVSVLGESAGQPLAGFATPRFAGRVIDLSALWAGPLCAGLLARAGADVVKISSIGRPDPTAQGSPLLDARINGQKQRLALDLRTEAGRSNLHAIISEADVLVTSARPAALARIGLEPARFPHLTWVAITAHGFTGPGASRVGFGDDCAIAGGLARWERGEPCFMGDALADPLTGLESARAVFAGQRGLIDMAMSRVAASYAALQNPGLQHI